MKIYISNFNIGVIQVKKNSTSFITSLFLLICLMFNICSNNSYVFASEPPSSIGADGVVLMDALTGQVLFSKNMNSAYAPASTTKIMTALLTLENCDLSESVTISANAYGIEGSKIWLLEGETVTVKDLLYSLMISSANDAATALAEHISGTVEDFAKLMNSRAKELGAKNTNFVNPHGLYDANHKTTAYDLALIMREVMKHPEFKEFGGAITYTIPANSKSESRTLWSSNKITNGSYTYEGYSIEASKTGYTTESLHSFVASAIKDNQRLIISLIHDNGATYYKDALDLFNYGFSNFELKKLYTKGDSIPKGIINGNEIPLLSGDDVYYVGQIGIHYNLVPTYNLTLDKQTYHVGDNVGEGSLTIDSNKINFPLLSGTEYSNTNAKSNSSAQEYEKSYMPFLFYILVICILILITRIIQVKIKRKSTKKRFK